MPGITRLLSILLLTLITSTVISTSSSSSSALELLSADGFKISVFNVDGWNITVIWFNENPKLGPDLVIEYCGKNIVYYKPYEKLKLREITGRIIGDSEEIVMRRISKYVGPRVNLNNISAVAEENERRTRIGTLFEEVLGEKANGKALGFKGVILVPFFDWEPPAITLIMYFGDKSFEEKERIVKKLLLQKPVVDLLRTYNVSYIIIKEAYSEKGAGGLARDAGDLLVKAYRGEIEVPESIKGIVKARAIMGGSFLGYFYVGFNVTAPDRTTIEEFIRWIRDNVKHCDTPLVVTFNELIPEYIRPIKYSPPTLNSSDAVNVETREVTRGSQPPSLGIPASLLALTLLLILVVYLVHHGRSVKRSF